MTVWLLIIEDLHTDIEVRVFATKEAAMSAFAAVVAQWGYDDPEPMDDIGDWLAYARLSGEGDAVRVEKAEVKGVER